MGIRYLAKAGFLIQEVMEDSDEEMIAATGENDFARKAKMLSVSFVIKARKL